MIGREMARKNVRLQDQGWLVINHNNHNAMKETKHRLTYKRCQGRWFGEWEGE
jgi:hypothetical protein